MYSYISKHNSTRGKQIQGWCYFAVKILSALLHKKLKHHKDDICLNCLNSFRTENKLKFHEKACKNKDFCGIVMPLENDNILELNQYVKSGFIYIDNESFIKKRDGCANNPENSSIANIGEHILCGYSISAI